MKATGKKYSNLKDLLRQTASEDEGEFVKAFEGLSKKRDVIKSLIALRAAEGLSQKDIADAMGHTQSKISKLESGIDGDIKLGTLSSYLEALGYSAKIVVTKPTHTIADDIKYHWHCLGKLLDRLLDLAHTDAEIAVGIGKLANEIGFNYMNRILGFMNKLPAITREKPPAVMMQVEEISDPCCEKTDDPTSSSPASRQLATLS